MSIDNSSYTVTSPDLILSDNGATIMIVSTNSDFVDGVKLLFEKYISSTLIFCVQDKITTEKNLAWGYYISRDCEMAIIDLDNCEWIDVCVALTKFVDDQHSVVFYTEKHKKREAELLVNTIGDYPILRNLGEIDDYIINEIVNKAV